MAQTDESLYHTGLTTYNATDKTELESDMGIQFN